ncbi:molybdopterin-synthase adenylyltransferase MoeB [Acetobacter estunensis]|uniref:Molybdopterin-synthase adenylyltransferase n=1 Tax=Acetobacter estunensis TaxID=104097 RepID=A0A967B825_9PROT|nr:molybdopterin-synthase adenylyltransferase MoeB [Acetobacter estunensis]NHO53891.1 molybdopterin-synthase adenylyltransferase MoeB [Acetobacter estunensis]
MPPSTTPPPIDLTEAEIRRYSRHILLPEVGGTGQMRLKNASVLIVGAGGLGSPVACYLAAAGVGRIGLVDHDHVELSNLQRQILHTTERVGQPKVASAARTLSALNPDIRIETHEARLTPDNAETLVAAYDLVCDGSDNFETRYLVNAACVAQRRTLVSAAIARFDGQLSTFRPHRGGPCYECLFPRTQAAQDALSCGDAGIFGAVAGVLGTLQATEALKELLHIGETLAGRLLLWDALATRFTTITMDADPACPVCGSLHRDASS